MTNPNQDIKVSKVVFLTPALIQISENNATKTVMASVDIINRKVYLDNAEWQFGHKVFEHLDEINTLPEDFFMAPPEVLSEAVAAQKSYEEVRGEVMTGE